MASLYYDNFDGENYRHAHVDGPLTTGLEIIHELVDPMAQQSIMQAIVQQVEALFSDENLVRDEFMNKNVHKMKGGFMNLKLLNCLRPMKTLIKTLTKEWQIVGLQMDDWQKIIGRALELGSRKLEMNESCTKVRRIKPVPPVDNCCKHSRTVMVINLPKSKEDVDQLVRDFSVFGHISLIRIVHPGNSNANHGKLLEYIKKNVNLFDENQNIGPLRSIGTIEFSRQVDARNCLEQRNRLLKFDDCWLTVLDRLCIIQENEPSSKVDSPRVLTENNLITSKNPSKDPSVVLSFRLNNNTFVAKGQYKCCPGIVSHSAAAGQVCPLKGKVTIIRQPLGPDGTKGFKHARS